MSSNPQIFIEDDGEDTPLAIYIDPTVEDLPRLRVAMKDRGANIVTRILDARIVLVSPSNPAQIKLLADEWGTKKGLVDSAWAREAVRLGFAQPMDQYLWNDRINNLDLENEDDVHFVEDNAAEPAGAQEEDDEPPTRSLSTSPIPIIIDRDSSLSLSPSPPPQHGGPIFQHNNETPFKFFIQMRFANRMALIRLVKKHGGQPTSDMVEADYCIMSRSIADFDILTAQLPRGKPAIQSEWLDACDRANRLLDWKPYVESASAPASAIPAPRRSSLAGTAPSSPAKKPKQSATASKPAPKASAASASKSTPKGSAASSSKPAPRGSIVSSSAGPSTPRPTRSSTAAPLTPKSNTPAGLNVAFTYTIDQDLTREPEPSTEIVAAPRGNLFTPDDNRFALQALKWLLHRDPMTTDNARDEYLARKAPHHSAMSWSTHMGRRLGAECRKLRQEAKAATAAGTPRLRSKAEEPRRSQAAHDHDAGSPAPPSKVVQTRGHGNAFTKEDHQYAVKLWKKMVQEDPFVTYTLLATHLSEKVPHHSQNSWMFHIRQKYSAEFDAIRDKARKNPPSGSGGKITSGYVGIALKSVSKPSGSSSATRQDEIAEDDPELYRSLTRTPPPPTHDERTSQGRVAFTTADRKWILQMHYVVLRRNLDAPPFQIAKYLHYKAPHHSEMSYSTYIARSCKNHYDNVRTAILKERAQHISGMGVSKGPASQSSASRGAGMSSTPARREPADLEQRVMRIAIYLDKARKQGLADEDALEALDADPCDLARTWGAFYEMHREAVNRRILSLEAPPATTPLKRTAETVDDLEAPDEKQRRMSSADTIVVDTVL